MGRIFEVTGKAVIYTADGVKVVDAQVRSYFNVNADYNHFTFKHDEPYLLIGGARTFVGYQAEYAKRSLQNDARQFV